MATPLERCEQAQVAETEPLPVTLDHDCGPWCAPCARDGCGHHDGRHLDSDDECLVPGCDCARWLSDTDCPDCDGTGDFWDEVPVDGGAAVREVKLRCPGCSGTGTTTSADPHGWMRPRPLERLDDDTVAELGEQLRDDSEVAT